jgi:hypothetical protein
MVASIEGQRAAVRGARHGRAAEANGSVLISEADGSVHAGASFSRAGRCYRSVMGRTGGAIAVLAIVVGACSSGSSGPKPPVVACRSANDCFQTAVNSDEVSAFCCLDGICAFGDSPSLVDCTDANVQLIQASSYDQTCTTNADCVEVAEGNACYPGFGQCPMATINVGAQAQYNNDLSGTNANICRTLGDCVFTPAPCCIGGRCQIGQCPITFPFDAATDAEGGTGSGAAGTSDAPAAG